MILLYDRETDILVVKKPIHLTKSQTKREARRHYYLRTGQYAPRKLKLISEKSWIDQYGLNCKKI